MIDIIRLTNHVKERALERHGFLSEEHLKQSAWNAVSQGVSYNDCKNRRVADWIKQKTKKKNQSVYVSGSYCFIFDVHDEYFVLITVFATPTWVRRTYQRKCNRKGWAK